MYRPFFYVHLLFRKCLLRWVRFFVAVWCGDEREGGGGGGVKDNAMHSRC